MMLWKTIRKWFPAAPDMERERVALRQFYDSSELYHAMTRGGDKTTHPQVRLLMTIVKADETYVEVGCGGGQICREVGQLARVIGVDAAPIAIGHAEVLCAGMKSMVVLACASAESIPLGESCVDGVYSFEVLEHLWDPKIALKEMIRVTKPGGFLLISMPNGFSLDLHLHKRRLVRCIEFSLAACRRLHDHVVGQVFQNVSPVLDGEVYPDCDLITAIVPANLAQWLDRHGCEVIFWDTFYMNAHRHCGETDLTFQRHSRHPFLKHFGDHLLLYARKRQ
jgi:ubiquinone/menaquinone biosynthesis C-methylase UbiE